MIHVSCSVADQEVIHIQSTVCSAIYVFHNIINFILNLYKKKYYLLELISIFLMIAVV